MTCWLFAWEFGEGLGHLRRMAVLADALARGDDRVVLATAEAERARGAFPAAAEIIALPPPEVPDAAPSAEGFLPSYGAALAQLGFEDSARIARRVAVWDEIFDRVKPAAVIADHAPFAVFAARGRLPAAVIGTGLDLPPAGGEVFPTILPGARPFDEARLHSAMTKAALSCRRPAPASAPSAMAGDLRLLIGLPAFDPYAGRRSEAYLSPVGPRPRLSPCPAEGLIFAYLRSDHPSFTPITWALAELGMPMAVHWQGGRDAEGAALLAARGAELFDQPPDVRAMLPRASLVISLGGAGLTADCLFAGRPHLVFPIHLESELAALGLERLGAGRRLGPQGITQAIADAAESLELRDGALRAGEDAHRRFLEDPAPTIAARIRAMAAKGPGAPRAPRPRTRSTPRAPRASPRPASR
ncbi:MAG: glycosyltransferase [Caulobacterales bacterium]